MKNINRKLHGTQMFTQDSNKPFNIVCNLYIICNSQKLVSSFHGEKKKTILNLVY